MPNLSPLNRNIGTLVLVAVIGGELFYVHRLYDRKDAFNSYCSKRLAEENYRKDEDAGLCKKLENSFFHNDLPVQEIKPSLLHAPGLPIDSQIKFIVFRDPRYLSLYAYCYFSYHGDFDPKSTSPMELSLSVSGFSIPKSELKGFRTWLKGAAGRGCVDSVQKSLGFETVDLDQAMGDKVAIIAFNPVGAIRSDNGWPDVAQEALRTVADERAHPIYLSKP